MSHNELLKLKIVTIHAVLIGRYDSCQFEKRIVLVDKTPLLLFHVIRHHIYQREQQKFLLPYF